MRLINLDDILKRFTKADFDGDDLENMKAYPHWKTDITGLFNILKSVPIIEPCEDCISREAVEKITWEEPIYTDALNVLTEVREKVRALPSVTPSIPDVENDFNLGYNCGYAEAMCDIGGEDEG